MREYICSDFQTNSLGNEHIASRVVRLALFVCLAAENIILTCLFRFAVQDVAARRSSQKLTVLVIFLSSLEILKNSCVSFRFPVGIDFRLCQLIAAGVDSKAPGNDSSVLVVEGRLPAVMSAFLREDFGKEVVLSCSSKV
jgi:hypothetical protein